MLGLGVLGLSPTMHGALLNNMSIKATFEQVNPVVQDTGSFGKELVNFARSTPYVISTLVEVRDLPLVMKQLDLTTEASWSEKFLFMVQKQLASLSHNTTA